MQWFRTRRVLQLRNASMVSRDANTQDRNSSLRSRSPLLITAPKANPTTIAISNQDTKIFRTRKPIFTLRSTRIQFELSLANQTPNSRYNCIILSSMISEI